MGNLKIIDVFENLETLETERLILRPFRIEDSKDLYEILSNENVTKLTRMDTYTNINEVINTINKYINFKEEEGQTQAWAIEYKQNGKMIGRIRYSYWDTNNDRAEIGYYLNEEYWGKGIMPEALKKVIEFGFTKMALHRIELRCSVENQRSTKVIEKAGLTYEGIQREVQLQKGEYKDKKLFSILKQEYEEQ